MGFIDDKAQTINNVALYEVLNGLPRTRATSSLDSVRSKSKNLLPYLIDLLSVTCKDNSKKPNQTEGNERNPNFKDRARCEAVRILTDILIEFFPALIRILKDALMAAIKAGLACSANFTIPNFQNGVINGPGAIKIKANIKNIDLSGQLKIDPITEIGSTFYGKNPTEDLNFFLANLIKTGGSTSWPQGAPIFDFNYDKTSQEIEFGLNTNYIKSGGLSNINANNININTPNVNFDTFIKDTVDTFGSMDREQFMAKIMNKLTNTLKANLPEIKSSLEQLISEEKLDKLQDKINNSDPCKEDFVIDNSYFTFNNDDLLEIENRANEKTKGYVTLDLGCGFVPVTVPPTTVVNVFNDIRNAPPSGVKVVIENSLNTLNNSLTSNVNPVDKQTAQLALNAKILDLIPKILTETIMEPKVVMLYQLASRLVNGPLDPTVPAVGVTTPTPPNLDIGAPIKVTNTFDYAKATSTFFTFVARESLAALLEIIFRRVKVEIVKLVTAATLKILKERLKLKLKALDFLIGTAITGVLTSIPTPDTSKYA